jgi:signal transduction histidine kinase
MVDVTDRKRAEEILHRNREELERLVAARTVKLQEMIDELQHVSYSIVHDLRAPLRAMQGFAALLEEECAGCQKTLSLEYFGRLQTAAARMDRLILDALRYNKAVLQDLPLEPVDLSELVPALVQTYPNLHPANAQIFIEGDLPVVLGNETLLTQCFSNLLGNAVKFVASDTMPQVRLRGETREHMARIWIEDNGIGIPQSLQGRLFGMFQRLTDGFEGTGMGLAIVRKVVERMGGKVGVESEQGQGSRFWVELRVVSGGDVSVAPADAVR